MYLRRSPNLQTVVFLKTLFILLHVLTAAAWFGLALRAGAWARTALQLSGEARSAVLTQGMQTMTWMGGFLLATFAFGLGALFAGGGFGVYGPQYHTSLLLMLLLIAVHYLIVARAWKGLGDAGGEGSAKKLAMGTGISHLLWVVILVLMLWQYPGGGFGVSL